MGSLESLTTHRKPARSHPQEGTEDREFHRETRRRKLLKRGRIGSWRSYRDKHTEAGLPLMSSSLKKASQHDAMVYGRLVYLLIAKCTGARCRSPLSHDL